MTNLLLQQAIEVDPTGYWYRLFYQLAVFAALFVFLSYGYLKKYPLNKWLLLSATATFCGILGSKVGTYGFAEWQMVWENGALLENTNRTSIGAFVVGLSGIFLGIRLLRLPKDSFDVYAYLIPVVVIFQRVGCLLGACCFGTPTNGSWGIQYNGMGLIRDHHINSGWVSAYEMSSCLVHPVPLYFVIGGVLSLWIVFKMRNSIKVGGNLALFSIATVLLFRFFIEFFRDGITNHQMGELYVGLKGVQWVLLLAVVFLFVTVLLRVSIFYATFLSLLMLLSRNIFTQVEIGIMHSKLVLVWFVIAYFLIARIQLKRIRWQAIAMGLLSFVMMSQTYPENANDLSGQKDISISAGFSELDKEVLALDCISTQEGCGGDYCAQYDSSLYNLRYITGKIAFDVIDYYKYSEGKGNKYSRYGMEWQPEYFYNDALDELEQKHTFMPYWGFGNTRIFETRLGLRIGSVYTRDFLRRGDTRRTQLTINQRLGNLNGLFVNFALNNAPDVGPSVNLFHASLNYNLAKVKSGPLEQISIGTSEFLKFSRFSTNTFYFETRFLFNEHWFFSPRFGALDLPTGNDVKPRFYYGIRAGYRFRTGKKED